ncbi:GNAT family N-acetyltransferase [uncultured Clostridium sp.]|uniref:GNAT family N-acetyltransferase n=1 Tax=uncultured Clostridium sp. TaxID=59620 RepID=UPI0025D7508E|nr:GNAT family N-acetyltransferase [uncultured Clostridium sp.]
MITIEKLSFFNIESFRKLYNKDYRSYICDKDFFEIYDKESFIVRYMLRKQVKLFRIDNKLIGYIWYDQSKVENTSNNIYSLYIMDKYIDLFDNKFLNFIKCNVLKLDIVENEIIIKLMDRLGFGILTKTCLMKLESYPELNEVEEDVEFKHFVENCDERLRCRIQNCIFYEKNRIPLDIYDIYEEEEQDYYINDFSVFLCVKYKYVGYGQIILSNGLYTIVNFGIIKEYRGQGYGTILLNYLIELCKINDIDDIYIRVEKDNYKAVSLYNKVGFRECTSYDTWYKYII